jgi:glycosyltransferase involved in cell wall biosynthesis
MVLEKHPEVQFVIAGDGPMRSQWIKQAEQSGLMSSFLFPGRIPYEQVPVYVNAFTICLAPFVEVEDQKIGSPLKLYDYLACGKAVIGSGIDEIYALINGHQAGLTVPPMDPKALGEAILSFLDDEDARTQCGENGYRLIRNKHTWDHVAERLIKISQACLK